MDQLDAGLCRRVLVTKLAGARGAAGLAGGRGGAGAQGARGAEKVRPGQGRGAQPKQQWALCKIVHR